MLPLAGKGGRAPDLTRALPLDQTEGLPSLRSLDPHHRREAVPETVGPEPQGTGGVHPLLQMAGHAGQREANKQLTKVYCPPRQRSPK